MVTVVPGKAVVSRSVDGLVLFVGEGIYLSGAGCGVAGEWIDKGTTTANAVLYNDVVVHGEVTPGRWVYDGKQFSRVRDTEEQMARLLAARLDDLAAYRYEREVGGVIVDGVSVDTSRERRSMLFELAFSASRKPNVKVDFKAVGGRWLKVDSGKIVSICDAVDEYVQGCFSTERHHAELMSSITNLDELAGYDYTAGWP